MHFALFTTDFKSAPVHLGYWTHLVWQCIKSGIQKRETECGECYIPRNVAKYSRECPRTFRSIRHSSECSRTFSRISGNIPRNITPLVAASGYIRHCNVWRQFHGMFHKTHRGKHLCQSIFLNKVSGLRQLY